MLLQDCVKAGHTSNADGIRELYSHKAVWSSSLLGGASGIWQQTILSRNGLACLFWDVHFLRLEVWGDIQAVP